MESFVEKVDPEEIVRKLERLIAFLTKKYKLNDEKERKTVP
jgi:hypothetical protein